MPNFAQQPNATRLKKNLLHPVLYEQHFRILLVTSPVTGSNIPISCHLTRITLSFSVDLFENTVGYLVMVLQKRITLKLTKKCTNTMALVVG